MSIPKRYAEPEHIGNAQRIFFVTSRTFMGKALLRVDRNAELLVDVLRSCVASKHFSLHDFVIMPNHIHLLMELGPEISIEKAMQYVKGGFSFRMKRENGYPGEIWQRGFSEIRILDDVSLQNHREYIAQNPVKAGLVDSPEKFKWPYAYLAAQKAGAKAQPC